jgi:hypothetical protein
MGRTRKVFTLAFLLVLLAASLSAAEPAFAQSNSVLAAPQFTVTYVDKSYDVEPTYGVDEYTGQTVVKTAGYHVQNASVVVSIKNQPFTPYSVGDHTVNLYYNISVKGHFGSNWQYYTHYYVPSGEYSSVIYISPTDNEADTLVAFGFSSNNGSTPVRGPSIRDVSVGGDIDFRVQAYAGYFLIIHDDPNPFNFRNPYHSQLMVAESGDWSSIQTINIPSGRVSVAASSDPTKLPTPTFSPSPSPSPTATVTPAQLDSISFAPQIDWLEVAAFVIVGVVVTLLIVIIAFMHRKIRVLEPKRNETG